MSTDKKYTPEEVKNIFANQKNSFGDCEDIPEKFKDMDFSSVFDFTADDAVFQVYNNFSPEDCMDLTCEDYNTSCVLDQAPVAQFAAGCLEKLYSHVKTGKIDRQLLHVNEKLICFAMGADLVNAVVCMGLQLSVYNRSNMDSEKAARPAFAGEMLDYYENLVQILDDYYLLDTDAQTTLAEESDILNAEAYLAEELSVYCFHILESIKKASGYVPAEGEIMFRPEMFDIAADVLKLHYEEMYEKFSEAYDKLSRFSNALFEYEIMLDDDGSYNPELSVFRLAKQAAFGDADYPLYGDENRVL